MRAAFPTIRAAETRQRIAPVLLDLLLQDAIVVEYPRSAKATARLRRLVIEQQAGDQSCQQRGNSEPSPSKPNHHQAPKHIYLLCGIVEEAEE